METQGVGQPSLKVVRKVEKGKAKIFDFVDITVEEIDTSVPPPSPPHDAFREDEATKVLANMDRAIIPSVILEDEVTGERVIASKNFLSDDNFVNLDEFNSFWLRVKLKDLSEEEIRNFDKNSIKCTLKEGRELVKKSGILLVPGWDLEKIFVLDQVMRHEDLVYAQEFKEHGSGVNPSIKTFSLWSKAPSIDKPVVLRGMEHKMGDTVVRTLVDTTASEATTVSMHVAHFAKLVIEEKEKQHERLKALHVALNADHRRLFIENAKLRVELVERNSTSVVGPKPKELEKKT